MRKEDESMVIDNQLDNADPLGVRFHCQLSFINCQLTRRPQGSGTYELYKLSTKLIERLFGFTK